MPAFLHGLGIILHIASRSDGSRSRSRPSPFFDEPIQATFSRQRGVTPAMMLHILLSFAQFDREVTC